ncbi:MAG: carboxypeptidase-like regulatory domain-containing protein [Pirellulales bacterium]|nr:carboxypeptidase-like regulatory domain-containing protein [Pirellulales bacterium]
MSLELFPLWARLFSGVLLIGTVSWQWLDSLRETLPSQYDRPVITGNVRMNGLPTGGVVLRFFANKQMSATSLCTTVTNSEGEFYISRRDLSPGEYHVTASWRPKIHEYESLIPGPERLPRRYQEWRQTPLLVRIDPAKSPEIDWSLPLQICCAD